MKLIKRKFNWFYAVICLLLIIYSISMLLPFVWMVISSFKEDLDFAINIFGLPSGWKKGDFSQIYINYNTALNKFYRIIPTADGQRKVYLWEMLLNSVIYAFGCALFNTAVCAVMAYVCSKYKNPFNKIIYGIVIVTMIIPIVGSLPSEIQMAKALNFYDNILGLYIMKANFLGVNFLIFYAAFKTISWSYAEAGFVDGASHFKVMSKLMFPMVLPVIVIVYVLSFIGYWNDYYVPMIYLPSMPTAAYGLFLYQNSSMTEISTVPMQLAGCMVVFIPIFIIFLLFQKKMVGNITAGGLKG